MDRKDVPPCRQCFNPIPSLLATILLLYAATAGAQIEQPTRTALRDSIQVLRTQARFTEAQALAEKFLVAVKHDSTSRTHEITDAERLLESMKYIAGLPEQGQQDLAAADRMQPEILQARQRADYKSGVALAEDQLSIRIRLYGNDHPDVAKSLNNLGALLAAQGEYSQVEPYYKRALAIQEKVLGPSHPDVAMSLNNLGVLYKAQGQYVQAAPLFERALAIQESTNGPDHPDVASILNNLARNHEVQGQYEQARPLYERSMAIDEKTHGPDHPYVAMSMNNLANLNYQQGLYAQAESFYQRASAIFEKSLGLDHLYVAYSLNGLAALYCHQGQYAQAEPLYRRALAILEKSVGPDHPLVAACLNNLGVLAKARGQYAQAEPLYQRALAITEKSLGPDHSDVATNLSNLAGLYYIQGHYAQAEPLYLRTLAIREGAFGPDHPDVALSLNNLAALYDDGQGQYTRAEPLYHRALATYEKVLGADNPEFARTLNNLAAMYGKQRRYAQAEPLYRRALAIRKKTLGSEHPDVAWSMSGLADLLSDQGQFALAAALLDSAANVFETARLRTGEGLERATFRAAPYAALAASLLLSGNPAGAWPAAERDLGRVLADLLLRGSERQLTSQEAAYGDSLGRSQDSLEIQLTAQAGNAPDSTGEAAMQGLRTQLLDVQAEWSRFQREMAQKYPLTEGRAFPLERVQAVLGKSSAILGWLNTESTSDQPADWAYVLKAEGPVQWVQLPKTAAADTVTPVDQARACSEALRSSQDADATVAAFSAARFQPLLPALAGIEDLIVIPTGAMATIPIEALMDDQGRRLGDRFTISYAPSATIYTWLSEARLKEAPPLDRQIASGKALLLGDPPFTPKQRDMMLYEVPAIATETTETAAAVEVATLRGAVVGDEAALAELPRLRNSRREVQAIEYLSDGPTVLLGPAASEQALVKLAESGDLAGYRTIHLATHAAVDQERPERSCLILSRVDLPDAYEAAKRGERIYDGRLTVQEILQEWKLDADLVTLSACETGLGQDVRGEGLVGFAHAFLQAGARSLLVSLWKVDDRATSLFMTRFYGNLWERQMGKAAALREAKEWLRGYEDKFGKRPYGSPYFWSAFILIGDRG